MSSLQMMSQTSRLVLVAGIVCAFFANRWWRTPDIPPHLLAHDAKFIPGLIEKEHASELLELIKQMADFPSNANDLEFYKTVHEHMGEAQRIGSDGTCKDTFLVPNVNKTLCVFPGRIDVARHFFKHGGLEGVKERFEVSASRLQSFGRYIFDPEQYPLVKKLFDAEVFQDAARSICPDNKQVLDPFQFNFIIQVPGQSVALHLDASYFTWATRFQYPQWLLTVMTFSGLWQNDFVDQIQVVGYLHEWNSTERGGQFTYWTANELQPHAENPEPRAGSIVDGSKTVHASTIYMPSRRPPMLPKSADNRLVFKGNDEWEVTSNGEVVDRYKTDDLRISIVYRARCFESEERRHEFRDFMQRGEAVVPIENILNDLKTDLVARRGYSKLHLDTMLHMDLAMTLLNEYVKYPLPAKAIIPFNYCLLSRLFPWTEPVINRLC